MRLGWNFSRTLPKDLKSRPIELNERGRPLCRWCREEVPAPKRTFCGPDCIHEWLLRTDSKYLREQVFKRDKGVCARCGVDAHNLRLSLLKMPTEDRLHELEALGFKPERLLRALWEADHILSVVEGGGSCGLSNIQTLCVKCHSDKTRALRTSRSRRSSREK